MEISILEHTAIETEKFRSWNSVSEQGSLYTNFDYLNVICPGWSAIVVEVDSQIIAWLPMDIKKKGFLKYALQPLFSQYFGVIFHPEIDNTIDKKNVVKNILIYIEQHFFLFLIRLHPFNSFLNCSSGKRISKRDLHTYLLETDLVNQSHSRKYSTSITNDLKKAIKKGIKIRESNNCDWILQTHQHNPHAIEKEVVLFTKIWNSLKGRQSIHLLEAYDSDNVILASGAFIEYQNRLIFILSAINPFHRHGGANALLIHHAIQMAKESQSITFFDFEGSMVQGVDIFFRGFRPEKIIYPEFSKRLYLIKLIQQCRKIFAGKVSYYD